jgi:sugar O-acyltransferase (sialic acid O-acetyltransferase NeuD family)
MKVKMILFGTSNMISDVYECVCELGMRITCIVLNVTEEKRERTKGLETRLRELNERPQIISLEEFCPIGGEEYFVVPVTPEKSSLIERLVQRYQLKFSTLVHPTAYVSPYATIGQGVFIGAGSVIGPGAVLRNHVSVGRSVSVGHDTVVHEYVRLNPGCNIAGHVEILAGAIIGLGAGVIEELVIGPGAVVAAGAMVIKDVQERALVAGVPAVFKKTYAA